MMLAKKNLILLLAALLLSSASACKKNTRPDPVPTEDSVQIEPPPENREVAPAVDLTPAIQTSRDAFLAAIALAAGESDMRAAALERARDPFVILDEEKSARGKRDLVLVAVGDVSQPTKQWREATMTLKEKAFEPTQYLLDSGDLVFMNLENPISDLEPSAKKKYAFTSAPERLGWYFDVGFNLFSLSNNHIADADQAGIDDTLSNLERERSTRGVQAWWAGVGQTPEEAEAVTWVEPAGKDLKIAYFSTGFSKGKNVSKFWSKTLPGRIAEAKKSADIVIVSVHAGKEYLHVPKPDLADIYRGWIDAGADIVIGHHPHVIRPVEVYKEGLILHSLGNHVFASRTVRHRKFKARMYGLVTRVVIRDGKVSALELTPTWVNNSGGWTLPSGERMPNANFSPKPLAGGFVDVFFEDFGTWTEEAGATPIERHGDVGRLLVRPDVSEEPNE